MLYKSGLFIWILFSCASAFSQDSIGRQITPNTTIPQKDLIDILHGILYKNPPLRADSGYKQTTKLYVSPAPLLEYTVATDFVFGVDAIAAFNTSSSLPTNTSTFLGALKYTTKKQLLFPIQSTIWLPGNTFAIIGDWRYLNFPQDAFGYGTYTKLSDQYTIDYKYLRFYETVLKNIGNNWYAGFGYQLDYHWNISEKGLPVGTVSDYQKYGFANTSTSSGATFTLLYDTRKNPINPVAGNIFASIQLLKDATWLGANSNYSTLTLDLRRYIKMPWHTLLGFWCYGVFTLNGNPPYLDLAGAGLDSYNNTSRGYQQGRFVGKNMLALETEWRFNLSKNGLFGGVIFANTTTLSELASNRFEKLAPAVGAGLRVKFNKFSKTNIAIDYGIGTGGSKGYSGNLGEVF
jgi:hypothetical protein